ncbi:enoyl-CoA hydratase/carnithine racemase [Rhodoligotrophos appendicifer]|uniref:enoyl-CoA hydratase/isomerase family protein n=1 Tax=Rhodoligotrophos appendicifer TaxID=987056 RepID=UPI00117BEC61|nr:enoyl-CoA hydratase/isomerase family protein [Rhodoligotrophos appendicifer]
MTSSSPILRQSAGGVMRLTINRPEARNALNDQVLVDLEVAIRETQKDSANRVIVVTGAGDRAFCAGGDLKPNSKTFGFDPAEPRTAYAELLRTAKSCTLPLIARVNGHCLAGGMGILAMCDMAVATSKALFGLPEVKIGLFPMQVAALLHSIVPRRKFDEMCITGEPISAEEAREIGLVNYVTEPHGLDEKLEWLVGRTLDKSPTAIRRGKYALRAISDMTFEQSLFYMENQIVSLALTEDAAEGLAAFNEKRAPAWTGR